MPPRDPFAPGAPNARAEGCTCSSAKNRDGVGAGENGRGEPLFIIEKRCPLHGEKPRKSA